MTSRSSMTSSIDIDRLLESDNFDWLSQLEADFKELDANSPVRNAEDWAERLVLGDTKLPILLWECDANEGVFPLVDDVLSRSRSVDCCDRSVNTKRAYLDASEFLIVTPWLSSGIKVCGTESSSWPSTSVLWL